MVNSFVFTAYAEAFKVILGLMAAMLLRHLRRGRAVIADVLSLPWVVPTVVTAFAWRNMLDRILGSVNDLLTASGIGPLPGPTWINQPGSDHGHIAVPEAPGRGFGDINEEGFRRHLDPRDPVFFAESTHWDRESSHDRLWSQGCGSR